MKEIVNYISDNRYFIKNNISRESIDVYCFLQKEFKKGNVSINYLFQFVYRSFYRLDNAGLSKDFKIKYFELLEKNRHLNKSDYKDVAIELYKIPNLKNQNTLQFSFVTKMFNTINPALPIYDSEVARVFKFRPPSLKLTLDERLEQYLLQLTEIKETYETILKNGLLNQTLELCRDTIFYDTEISDVKALDFIFWSAGKVMKNPELIKGEEGIHTLEELDEMDRILKNKE